MEVCRATNSVRETLQIDFILAQLRLVLTLSNVFFVCRLEGEIIRQCLRRPPDQCQILQVRGYSVVYRRYASLFFIVGTWGTSPNELAILEFIHCLVETMDRHFNSVCELDIMFNLEKAHFILDEMISSGSIYDANKCNALATVGMVDNIGNAASAYAGKLF